MEYGYARISRKKQNIERQIRNIKAQYPAAVIIQEAYTGTKLDRGEWNRLYQRVAGGDRVIFDSVSRMSRSAEEGYAAYEALFHRGVDLVFLKEPHISTETFKSVLTNTIPLTGTNVDYILAGVNQYLLALAKEQIRIAFDQAEKEVSDLHQRTREGIETARLNGKQIGLPKGRKLTTQKSLVAKAVIRKHSKDFSGTLTDSEVICLTGIARNTYYKYKRELREAGE